MIIDIMFTYIIPSRCLLLSLCFNKLLLTFNYNNNNVYFLHLNEYIQSEDTQLSEQLLSNVRNYVFVYYNKR